MLYGLCEVTYITFVMSVKLATDIATDSASVNDFVQNSYMGT